MQHETDLRTCNIVPETEHSLNPDYTFSNFILGKSNELAHSAAQKVISDPGNVFNPIYIYGGSGLGKTHLLHAIGHGIIEKHPQMKMICVSCEKFINEWLSCLKTGRTGIFRKKYRTTDILIIDDIQILSNKENTQEEFLNTFNVLHSFKKQIVIASDVIPGSIADIEPRLKQRFDWGLIADVRMPDLEHRVAILRAKAKRKNIGLPDDVALFIAEQAKRDIRQLEGLLNRVIAKAEVMCSPVNLSIATMALSEGCFASKKLISIGVIQDIVARHFQIKQTELRSDVRCQNLCLPRHIAMYLVRKNTRASLPDIGSHFGGKDHTTVRHAIHKITNNLEKDLELASAVKHLQNKIDGLA